MNLLLHSGLVRMAATGGSQGNPAFSALIWWLVPLFAVSGAIIYVIWVSRFKDKFENETNRSVTSFQSFQRSFDGSRGAHGSVKPIPPASDPLNPEEAG
jgi:hypothetical protein